MVIVRHTQTRMKSLRGVQYIKTIAPYKRPKDPMAYWKEQSPAEIHSLPRTEEMSAAIMPSGRVTPPSLRRTTTYGNKSVNNYLNTAAFAQPALGTLGNMGAANVRGSGYWGLDVSLVRSFQPREAQRLEFRVEAFNLTNSLRMNDPTVAFNSSLFGKITTAPKTRGSCSSLWNMSFNRDFTLVGAVCREPEPG